MVMVVASFRIKRRLLEELDKIAHRLGMTRSEAIEEAITMFVEKYRDKTGKEEKKSFTSRMRGLIKANISLNELEEAYMVQKL